MASLVAGLIILIYIMEGCQMYIAAEQLRAKGAGESKPYETMAPIMEVAETSVGCFAMTLAVAVFAWSIGAASGFQPGLCEDRTALTAFLLGLSAIGFGIEVAEFLIADPLEGIQLTQAPKSSF